MTTSSCPKFFFTVIISFSRLIIIIVVLCTSSSSQITNWPLLKTGKTERTVLSYLQFTSHRKKFPSTLAGGRNMWTKDQCEKVGKKGQWLWHSWKTDNVGHKRTQAPIQSLETFWFIFFFLLAEPSQDFFLVYLYWL